MAESKSTSVQSNRDQLCHLPQRIINISVFIIITQRALSNACCVPRTEKAVQRYCQQAALGCCSTAAGLDL